MLARKISSKITAATLGMLVLAACSSSTSASGTGAEPQTKPITFSAVPNQQSANLQENYQSLLAMLQKETGREVRFVVAPNYEAVIDGLRDGSIDVADLGSFAYVIAKDGGVNIAAVAARVTKKGDPPGYRSYGIVPAGSPIVDITGFRGKKVCFVDPKSTSGFLYPKAGLLAAGINPDADIDPIFSGAHDTSVLNVVGGKCDAGFAYDTMVDRQLIERGSLKPGQIAVVWRSEIIPGSPVVVKDDLDAELLRKLTEALQQKANSDYLKANGFCAVKCAIAGGDDYGFVPVDDSLYNGVRAVCKLTNDESCRSS